MPRLKLSDAHKQIIAGLYSSSPLSRDELPYTAEFDRLYAEFLVQSLRKLTPHEFWTALSSAGKASRLGRKKR
jgi:hypothetical protein